MTSTIDRGHTLAGGGAARRSPRASRRGARARRWSGAALFIAPAFAIYALFLVYPLLTALGYSFYSWSGITPKAFVGFENYVTVFDVPQVGDRIPMAFVHNILIFAGNLIAQMTLGLGCAVLLLKRRRGRRFFQTAIAMPYLINPLAIGFLFNLILSAQLGSFNTVLRAMGLGEFAQPWLGQESTLLPIVIAVGAWQWVGFPTLIFGAALSTVAPEVVEAARMDGASPWRVLRSVQLPLITPAIGAVSVLAFVSSFNTFALVAALADIRGGVQGAADTLGLIFYRTAFGSTDSNAIGHSSAIAVMMFIFIFSVAAGFNRSLRKREEALQ